MSSLRRCSTLCRDLLLIWKDQIFSGCCSLQKELSGRRTPESTRHRKYTRASRPLDRKSVCLRWPYGSSTTTCERRTSIDAPEHGNFLLSLPSALRALRSAAAPRVQTGPGDSSHDAAEEISQVGPSPPPTHTRFSFHISQCMCVMLLTWFPTKAQNHRGVGGGCDLPTPDPRALPVSCVWERWRGEMWVTGGEEFILWQWCKRHTTVSCTTCVSCFMVKQGFWVLHSVHRAAVRFPSTINCQHNHALSPLTVNGHITYTWGF